MIREFALQKPVSRLLVNTPGALGGVGASTNLPPALTLGCGSVGGSATSDNVGPLNLINIRRVAWGVRELEDLRADFGGVQPTVLQAPATCGRAEKKSEPAGGAFQIDPEDIERIAAAVMERLGVR